jgi:putative ABC transport system ATP-binding protein
VGLGKKLRAFPGELSGGEMQRAAIARALIHRPRLVIADEPTGNLDSQSGAEVLAIFARLHLEGRTIVIITHEPGIAAHARRVVRLADGRVVDDEERMPMREAGAR